MNDYNKAVTLRVDCEGQTEVVKAKQLDNQARTLTIKFLDASGEEIQWDNTIEAEFRFQRPDGYLVVTDANVANTTVSVQLTELMLEIAGRSLADVRMKQGNKIISGGAFFVDVFPTAIGKEQVSFSGTAVLTATMTKEQYESYPHNKDVLYLVTSEEAGEAVLEFYFGNNKVDTSSMTKEEIITAIVQIVESGEVKDIDTGFVTTIKEQNNGLGLKFWVGTTAEYEALSTKENTTLYIKTDDPTYTQITSAIQALQSAVSDLDDLGTASKAGLCKIINDFNEPTGDQSGRALAASAGYVLSQTLNTVQQQGTTNAGRIEALETTVAAHTEQLNALNTKTHDTGWYTLPLASGVSAATTGAGTPKFRVIGNHIYIRGSVTFTVPASGSTTLATLPNEVLYPSAAKYDLMACDNNRMAQNHINTSGQVICDYIVNVNDGSRFSGTIEWADITMDFFTD